MADASDSNQNNLPDCTANLKLGSVSLTDDEAESNDNDTSQKDEFFHTLEWKEKKKHIFILSTAGKPVYSRYGNEDRLVTLCGVIQALVSFVQDNQDSLQSIKAGNCIIGFLHKGPIILVSVSRTSESVEQLKAQLLYVYNQVVSILTLTQLTTIFEQRKNFDLRRLLAGSERLIDHFMDFMESQPAFLLGAVKCLPLASATRETISQTIINCCAKIKNLVFAILIANNKLITIVKIKKYGMFPSDLHIIFNMVNSSEAFKTAECWTPICLPTFEPSGFLHSHVSYLAEDCQACLLLLSTDRDSFFTLSEAKQSIVEKLRRNNCLEAINETLNNRSTTASDLGIPNLRHFLYKCNYVSQYWGPKLEAPYTTQEEKERLLQLYQNLHSVLHNPAHNLKLLHQQLQTETMFGWITHGFELYITFDALVSKVNSINAVNKILRWMKKEEERLFILNTPTF